MDVTEINSMENSFLVQVVAMGNSKMSLDKAEKRRNDKADFEVLGGKKAFMIGRHSCFCRWLCRMSTFHWPEPKKNMICHIIPDH
jgi:hypothetical protein